MYDVIICLGRKLNGRDIVIRKRVKKTVELFGQGRSGKIVFSGGVNNGRSLSEAGFMKKIGVDLGLEEENIILEEKSDSTITNAKYCQLIMDENNYKSAIVVTSPWHIRRTKNIFN